jgi:pyruvate formate lyase activating enzyme
MKTEAQFYKVSDGYVTCLLCPHLCKLKDGQAGLCSNRFNENGKLYTNNYGEVISLSVDPIEKKPLYHFYPGHQILSTGPNGCNLNCAFCQNWQISNAKSVTRFIKPEELAELAIESKSIGIAYTYTEPTIWFEYLLETAKVVKEHGMVNVMVTNGFINPEPLEELLPYIDAMNIDLKAYDETFYKDVCSGKLQPVLETIRNASKKIHVEITNLLIPDLNDSREHIEKLTDFIAEIDKNIPLHISRYFPAYRFDKPPTAKHKIKEAIEIAKSKLNYVYAGNIALSDATDTKCIQCGNLLIKRSGYDTQVVGIENKKCTKCGRAFDGVI